MLKIGDDSMQTIPAFCFGDLSGVDLPATFALLL